MALLFAIVAAIGTAAAALTAFWFIGRQRYGASVLAVLALAALIYLFCTALLDAFPELR